MQAAVVQMCSGPVVADNLAQAERLLRQARALGADLAVLPENFALMGGRETDKLAAAERPGEGPIQSFLAQAAQRLELWIVAGTLPMAIPADPGRVHAASLVYDTQGRCVARYDKIHLFDVDLPGSQERYRESATIAPGDAATPVISTPLGSLGLSVCYDLRFPEHYRRLAAAGAELLAVPSAFTRRTGEAHWEVLLRARAIENQCYVLASNQGGQHPGGRETWGHSMIIDPWGAILAQSTAAEPVAVATIDREHLEQVRTHFPALRHRRLSP